MADREPMPTDPAATDASRAAGPTGMPRWVKVFVLMAAVVLVIVVIKLLAGGGHGPSRHMSAGPPVGAAVDRTG